jgi:hypothetical protein
VFRDVLTGYALELKAQHALATPNFTVTPAMVNVALSRMRARGIAVVDSTLVGARHLIGDQLGYEAARYVFGRAAEVKRRMHDDHQIQRALELATRARAPQDLFALTNSGAPSPKSP